MVTIDRRAIPSAATESLWQTADGWDIRRIDWRTEGPGGSILFLPGRGDIYEKYLETLHGFWEKGWNVTASDWRGQGGSGRFTDQPHVGHVDDFGSWIADLAFFWKRWKQEMPGPHVVIGHSMGGHLVLRALAERAVDPEAAVLSAPMLGIRAGGVPSWIGHAYAKFMSRIGDSARAAWKVSEKPGASAAMRHKLLTHDKTRYDDEPGWWELRPQLEMGPASWGWVERAIASTRLLERPGVLERVDTPMLILATTADQLVDSKRIIADAERLPQAELVLFGRGGCARAASGGRSGAQQGDRRDRRVSGAAVRVSRFDVAIVGAGIAGASLAAALAPHRSVLLLEAEERPGYHSTGRSAAFWTESYGGPGVQPLTSASFGALSDGGFLTPRGALHLAEAGDTAAVPDFLTKFGGSGVKMKRLEREGIEQLVPGLRSGWDEAVWEPGCQDIDVAALHADYLRQAAASGTQLRCRAAVRRSVWKDRRWTMDTAGGSFEAALIIDAAGAWAEEVAERCSVRRCDIRPYRRSIAQLRIDPPAPHALPAGAGTGRQLLFQTRSGWAAVAEPA